MKLFSYCLRYDDGKAPNPYWGFCTLAICKPAIRRAAEIGDWIVGTGSANSPLGNFFGYVIYAMRVTEKMTMEEYDRFCTANCPKKHPDLRSSDYRRRVGDCIYDYSSGPNPKLRWSLHTEENRKTDLGGEFVLLSKHFYYFGNQPVEMPENLLPIIHATQGHKSDANQPYVQEFVSWIKSKGYRKNKLYGEPQFKAEYSRESDIQATCSARSSHEDE